MLHLLHDCVGKSDKVDISAMYWWQLTQAALPSTHMTFTTVSQSSSRVSSALFWPRFTLHVSLHAEKTHKIKNERYFKI